MTSAAFAGNQVNAEPQSEPELVELPEIVVGVGVHAIEPRLLGVAKFPQASEGGHVPDLHHRNYL